MKKIKLSEKNIKKRGINTKNLIKEHQLLLMNNNFRNNQNYVLGNYIESNVYNKYKKKNIIDKNIGMLGITFWYAFIPTIIIWFIPNIGKILALTILGLFLLLFLLYRIYKLIIFTNNYKNFYLFNKNFVGIRYVFRKNISKNIKRYDYIIFNKKYKTGK